MTVEANVAFGLKQERMPKDQIAARVAEMLEMVKLTPFAKRKPHQLSGGQKQRVALARSLAKKPKVLLLDEPLGALDRKLREETQFELTDLQVDLGLTFIIVTHDQEEAMTLADRIAVMNHGKIVQVGTPAEIYEQPNSRYVADFIGNINLLEGRVVNAAGGSVRMDCGGTGATVGVDQDLSASPGDTAWFAVRPEKIGVSLSPPVDRSMNAVEGQVWDIGYLGDISVYHVRLPTGATVKATVTNATRLVERPITWDDNVWLTWSRDGGVVLTS
jgi:putrescine transport system ATP-binding protein